MVLTNRKTDKRRPFFKKNMHEHTAWEGNQVVCGIDEVGRGCLAGPLVTAAVILPPYTSYRLLRDSKDMKPEERERAAHWIKRHCWYGYGIVHHRLIDKHNIWHATLIAMRRAVINLLALAPQRPQSIVVDAMPLKLTNSCYQNIPIHHFPFGEKKSSSIAAASIIAKVKRDAMMQHMDKAFPHYIWYANKGYGTQRHKDAIREHSHVILHRMTYLQHIGLYSETKEEHEAEHQQSIT